MNDQSFKLLNKKILFILTLPLLMLLGSSVSAQQLPPQQQQQVREDFSDSELKQFIKANQGATAIQQESQGEMVATIEEEGLDVNTFNEILTSAQNPEQEVNASEDELNQFNKIAEKLQVIQKKTEEKIIKVIEKEGIDAEMYQEIMIAYQASPKVKEKVDKLLE